jgi:L-serine deaminase
MTESPQANKPKAPSKVASKLKAEKAAKTLKKETRAAKKAPQLSEDEILLKAQHLQSARNQKGEERLKALIGGSAPAQNDFQKSIIADYAQDAQEFTKLQQAAKETQERLAQIEGRLKELMTLRRKYLVDIQKWDKPLPK